MLFGHLHHVISHVIGGKKQNTIKILKLPKKYGDKAISLERQSRALLQENIGLIKQ